MIDIISVLHFYLTFFCCGGYLCICGTIFSFFVCPRGVMVKSMDCGIVVSEFVLQFAITVTFG